LRTTQPVITENKTILVTGSSTGIGKCVAHGLHQRGYRVFASVRNADDIAANTKAGMDSLLLDYNDSASIKMAVESRFRENAYRAFQQHIVVDNSIHRQRYQKMIQRFKASGKAQPFTLPPQAVLKCVVHALESKRPKIRYPVTFPTYLFGLLKRVMSDRMLDRVLRRVG